MTIYKDNSGMGPFRLTQYRIFLLLLKPLLRDSRTVFGKNWFLTSRKAGGILQHKKSLKCKTNVTVHMTLKFAFAPQHM